MDVMEWTAYIKVKTRDVSWFCEHNIEPLVSTEWWGICWIVEGVLPFQTRILFVNFISWIVCSFNCITQFKFYLIFVMKLTRQTATKQVYKGYFCVSVIQHSFRFPACRSAVTFRYLEGTDARTDRRTDGRTAGLACQITTLPSSSETYWARFFLDAHHSFERLVMFLLQKESKRKGDV